VVYRDQSVDAVKARYPTVPGQSDYRFVQVSAAQKLFEDQLKSLDPIPRECWPIWPSNFASLGASSTRTFGLK
jgi:hypothetical protein